MRTIATTATDTQCGHATGSMLVIENRAAIHLTTELVRFLA